MRVLAPLSVAAILLSSALPACALPMVENARVGTDHHSAATMASDTADFIRNAALSNMFEIAAAKVAKEKSRNADVQRFAQMAINDHTAIENALAETLKQAQYAMTLPDTLDDQHASLVKQLESTPDAEFDTAYMQQQIIAHESALRVNISYAQHGRDKSLRQYAADTAPRMHMHLTLAERIFQAISPKTASAR